MHTPQAQDEAGTTSVAISWDGRLVAPGSLNTIVCLWYVQSRQLIHCLGHKDSVYSVTFTPDGNNDFPHPQGRAWNSKSPSPSRPSPRVEAAHPLPREQGQCIQRHVHARRQQRLPTPAGPGLEFDEPEPVQAKPKPGLLSPARARKTLSETVAEGGETGLKGCARAVLYSMGVGSDGLASAFSKERRHRQLDEAYKGRSVPASMHRYRFP
ncbi:hypothetical protein JB92DRAFT_3115480 [Gautieria morchelliformis]|nr:hypothetical protein JB92DRAFT_3115480 [Gautieria morchelliformis]